MHVKNDTKAVKLYKIIEPRLLLRLSLALLERDIEIDCGDNSAELI
jgi:hypothetical protein